MKANKFVQAHTLEKVKDILSSYPDHTHVTDDLKRIVESHELVKEHGTIERAKQYADSEYTAPEVSSRLKQAIADVESCQ